MADYYGNPAHSSAPSGTSSSTSAAALANTDHGKIFVGGLSWQTTEESLQWHFEQYGQVLSVELMKDRNTGKPRGFGFVCFTDPNTVDLVMAEDRHEVNHKIVDVKRAQARGVAPPSIHDKQREAALALARPRHANIPTTFAAASDPSSTTHLDHTNNSNSANDFSAYHGSTATTELTPEQLNTKVFVGGIPPNVDRDALRQIFEEFGPVQDSVVMLDQATNRSRGFGFVTFETGSNGAERAIQAQPIPMFGRSVEVKLATPRAEQTMGKRQAVPAAPKHLGLRAGQSSSSTSGEFAGLAVAYGRSGWKAGYGSRAFGKAGWAVQGWEDDSGGNNDNATEPLGFSFSILSPDKLPGGEPPSKRSRRQ